MAGPLISAGSALSALITSSFLTPVQPTTILSTFTSTSWITETVTSQVIVFYPLPSEITLATTSSVLSIPFSSNASATSLPALAATTSTSTVVITEVTTSIVTASASPSTLPSAPPLPSASSTSRIIWSAPAQMTDLSAFNVSSFSSGENNLVIVTGIPASASASPTSTPTPDPTTPISAASAPEPTNTLTNPNTKPQPKPATQWDNSTTVLQLRYPANSINPGNHDRPQGGAQFYATPLPEIAAAKSVTLTYSVFFPADFEWVLAGKLPGLYGGRKACSGGDEALDCFSTRLMWREDGLGELYLYAPKDKQAGSLCGDAQSVCDAAYGLSVGRGSFRWTKGGWTTVQQCVTLNTPGEHDGGFSLDVNGERVINRHDVFYRSVPPPVKSDSDAESGQRESVGLKSGYGVGAPHGEKGGGLLGPLLGGLLGRGFGFRFGFWGRRDTVPVDVPRQSQIQNEWVVELSSATTTQPTLSLVPASISIAQQTVTEQRPGRPIGFIGLFFSTFFGGHEPQYATPRDQYVWFKDFALVYNG